MCTTTEHYSEQIKKLLLTSAVCATNETFFYAAFSFSTRNFLTNLPKRKKNVSQDVFCNKMCHYIKRMKAKCRSVDLNRNLYLINYDFKSLETHIFAKIVTDCNSPSENGLGF